MNAVLCCAVLKAMLWTLLVVLEHHCLSTSNRGVATARGCIYDSDKAWGCNVTRLEPGRKGEGKQFFLLSKFWRPPYYQRNSDLCHALLFMHHVLLFCIPEECIFPNVD